MSDRTVNPFPEHHVGLWRVRAVPYPFKELWPEARFRRRWLAVKAKQREPVPAAVAGGGAL